MGMVRALPAAARGLASGMAVGAIWWVIEATLNWTAGGLVPGALSLRIGALDLAIAGIAGMGLGAAFGSGAPLALALAAVYGFLRVYRPPGFGAEALFVVLAVGAAALGVWLSGTGGQEERPGLAQPDGLRRRRPPVHAGALAGRLDAPGPRVALHGHVPEPPRRPSRRRLPARPVDRRPPPRRLSASRGAGDAGRSAARPWLPDRRLRRQLLLSLPHLRRGAGLRALRRRPRPLVPRPAARGPLRAAVRPRLLSQTLSQRARDQRRGARLARPCARRPAGLPLRQLHGTARAMARRAALRPLEPAARGRRPARPHEPLHARRARLHRRRARLHRGQLRRAAAQDGRRLRRAPGGVARARPLRDGTRRGHRRPRRVSRRPRAGGAHRPHALRAAAARAAGREAPGRGPAARPHRPPGPAGRRAADGAPRRRSPAAGRGARRAPARGDARERRGGGHQAVAGRTLRTGR